MTFEPIGTVYSPFQTTQDMPIQPTGAAGVRGTIELLPELAEGLRDLDGFSHIIVIYHFHKSGPARLTVTPFLDNRPHGVFATRAPRRPNPIGLSVLKLNAIEENRLRVENVDILDQTPVLDIKPYVPAFDQPAQVRTGWLEKSADQASATRSDHRFS